MKEPSTLCLLLCLAALALGAGCKGRNAAKELSPEQKQAQAHKEAQEEAKRAKFTTIPTKRRLVKAPFIKGGAIYFEQLPLGTWSKENFFYGDSAGSEKIRGKLTYDLDKVGTVILKPSCTEARSGSYGSAAAYVQTCEVLLIDPTIPAVIYETSFVGRLDNITSVSAGQTRVVGNVKMSDIYDFIASLPQR